MLKLKVQYFGHLMQRTDLLEKTLTLGKTKVQRRNKMTENKIHSTMGSKGMCMSKFPQWVTWKPKKPQSTGLQNT